MWSLTEAMLPENNKLDSLPTFQSFASLCEALSTAYDDSDSGLSSPPASPSGSDMFHCAEDSFYCLPTSLIPHDALGSAADIQLQLEEGEDYLPKHSLLEEVFLTGSNGPLTGSANLFEIATPVLLAADLDLKDTMTKTSPAKSDQSSKPVPNSECISQAKRKSSRLLCRKKVNYEQTPYCESEIDECQNSAHSVPDILPRSPRTRVSEDLKDEKYWERRRRNNMAAKRSREAKRAHHLEVAKKTVLLEKENAELRKSLQKLKGKIKKTEKKLCKKIS